MAQESNLPSLEELVASVCGESAEPLGLCDCWPGTRRFLAGLQAATDNPLLKEAIQLTIDLGNKVCGSQFAIRNYSPIGLKFESKPDKDSCVHGIAIESAEPTAPQKPAPPDKDYTLLTVLHLAHASGQDENGCTHNNSDDTHTDVYIYKKNIP